MLQRRWRERAAGVGTRCGEGRGAGAPPRTSAAACRCSAAACRASRLPACRCHHPRAHLLVRVVHVEQREVIAVDVGKAGLGLVGGARRLARPHEYHGHRQHGGNAARSGEGRGGGRGLGSGCGAAAGQAQAARRQRSTACTLPGLGGRDAAAGEQPACQGASRRAAHLRISLLHLNSGAATIILAS